MQPDARFRYDLENKAAFFSCRQSDDFVRETCDHWNQDNAYQEVQEQRIKLDDGKQNYRHQHHDHEKTRSTTRMLTWLRSRIFNGQRQSSFPCEYCLMLCAVIFEDAAYVL